MTYTISYYHAAVRTEIENWPDSILAHYAHILELLIDFGPQLGMPYSRAMGDGLFELRARGKEGVGRAFYCYVKGKQVIILHAFIKKRNRHRISS